MRQPPARHSGRNWLRLALLPVVALPLIAWVLVAMPFMLMGWAWDRIRAARLRRRFLSRWAPAGKRALLVYSNSPHWQSYIEQRWLPVLARQAVVLNWSERQQWPKTSALEAAVFRQWAGEREFNPIAIVFTFTAPARVEVVRFWQAFRDFGHGKPQALRAAEAELEQLLGVPLRTALDTSLEQTKRPAQDAGR